MSLQLNKYQFIILLLVAGCSDPPPAMPEPAPPVFADINILDHAKEVTLNIPFGAAISTQALDVLAAGAPTGIIADWIPESIEDSLKPYITKEALEILYPQALHYRISGFKVDSGKTVIAFSIDSIYINVVINQVAKKYIDQTMAPIEPLFSKGGFPPGAEVFNQLSLALPCHAYPVPDNANLLPNAPRTYRNGIHRGIDFWADWGTPVRAAAAGTIIRADHNYIEVAPEFRDKLLKTAHKTGHTPSDIFNHILLGQAVFIDHGFDLISGYRTISIYAHLSGIEQKLIPGTFVQRGERIGQSGNSGIRDATLGKKTGSHLHWELILQDADGEYYLGQGMTYKDLYTLLTKIFDVGG